jgi:hypothetical protein
MVGCLVQSTLACCKKPNVAGTSKLATNIGLVPSLDTMESPEPPLVVPITVSGASLEGSASTSTATRLLSWSTDDTHSGGVALGCENGSIYLFLPKSSRDLVDRNSVPKVSPVRATTTVRHSRSATPTLVLRGPSPAPSNGPSSRVTTALQVPFLPSKSKIQAEVSKEQVEAPKNYVDYDDEPAKLKGLLKGKGPIKERGVIDSIIPKFDRSIHLDRQSTGKSINLTLDREEAKSFLSASDSSPSWTPRSLSPVVGSPSSAIPNVVRTTNDPSDSLRLVAHIFPPRFGQGRSVTGLEALERGSLMVSLQECGYVAPYRHATIDLLPLGLFRCSRLLMATASPRSWSATLPLWHLQKVPHTSRASSRTLGNGQDYPRESSMMYEFLPHL